MQQYKLPATDGEIAKLLENSHAWLGASTSAAISEYHGHTLKMKAPSWTQSQLQEAIQAVVTQRMRFTQAATHYGIPKGTLYDNILGKSKRMAVLDEAGLTPSEERATLDFCSDSYQYQLQSMWQKCWSTNQSLVHNLRFRERGPLKSWRPETMAEAIFSVLKEGLSLSQAARKYDIPYPTFVLYANRVHNMLGPSADGGADLRPKGRGRPQRILLGVWPDEHIRGVIRAVVFRDSHTPHTPHTAHHIKEIELPGYPPMTDGVGVQNAYGSVGCGNGREGRVSPNSAAAAAVAAVAHGLRRQMCNMVVAAQRPPDHPPHLSLPPMPMHSPLSSGLESPLCSPPPPGHALEPPKPMDPFRPFASPRPESRYGDRDSADVSEMGPPKTPVSLPKNGQGSSPVDLGSPVVEGRGDM
ncbi:hypothetical protein K1T71_000063 [Dendrolimus kikuchii]|uniref:Uncharacterized protein n=1 Tax=Dendrolimus kikuchii TaxID=765133 RepID=A0ACC1DIL7_9NEOP|nr:hypothetical protein K1T71_000063 [Dendrolimus kikuchii]